MKSFKNSNPALQLADALRIRSAGRAAMRVLRSCKTEVAAVLSNQSNWVGAEYSPLVFNATKRNYQSINHQKVETKMVKFINKTLGGVLLGTVLLAAGCSPDNVNPKGSNNGPTINRYAENIHPVLNPVCSDSVYADLQDSLGGYNVSYCVNRPGQAPCPPVAPPWGRVEMVNGWDSIAIRVTMAVGWFIDKTASAIGPVTPLQVNPVTGRPVVGQDWNPTDLNEENSWTFYVDKRNIMKDADGCFQGAMRLKVLKKAGGFLGNSWDQASRRDLWISTHDLKVTSFQLDGNGNRISSSAGNPNNYKTANENILNWCWQSNCRTQKPGNQYLTNSCDAVPPIPTPVCTGLAIGHGCNYGSGTSSALNQINLTDVRCVDSSGNFGTFNFSGPGALIIGEGQTVTCGINAYYGCTLIVNGTLNWANTATYNGNVFIYISSTGSVNRVGTTSSLTMNGTGSVLVNNGTMDVDANLISKGAIYNTGTMTTRNLTLTGGAATFANKGKAVVENTMTVNCGSPSTCSPTAESRVQNCGVLDVNTSLTTSAGTNVKNYCSLVSRGAYTQGGSFTNQGLTIAGLSGTSNGFVNNGSTSFKHGSVVVSRSFNWGAGKTIDVNGNAWVIAANPTINTNLTAPVSAPNFIPYFSGMGTTGKLVIPTGAAVTGAGQLTFVDADPFGLGDVPLSGAAIKTTLNPNGFLTLTNRGVVAQDDSVKICQY
jgi:hypothetical protein